MNEYKIRYRSKSGNSEYFTIAESPDHAEDNFKKVHGNKTILGIYKQEWVAVG